MSNTTSKPFIEKLKRNFVPANFKITNWESLEPLYKSLLDRPIESLSDLEAWMKDTSELDAIVSEDMAWRYIKMTCDTTNEDLVNDYTFFTNEISPKVSPISNLFNKKLMESPYIAQLDKQTYFIYLRAIKRSIELFREENISLQTDISNESQKFGSINAKMTITHNDKEYTLQQAAVLMKSTDRELRKAIYDKVQGRRAQDEKELNELYDKLIQLRNEVALNAGYKNYRDYKHDELGRFDYKVDDCFDFHEAIKTHIVPIKNAIDADRKKQLGYDAYKPWDLEVDVLGREPLKPFVDGNDLLQKSIDCFYKVDTYCGDCLSTMRTMKHLDLESRKGKAPGGYNYPLYESGVPFIFMNAAGTHRDLVTMVHEGGHAVHSFLSHDLALTDFKSTPSEVAELASMSMELISMEHWQEFFPNAVDYKRARYEQLDKIVRGLTWIASIDKFQHWIYTNPTHTHQERYDAWMAISKDFGSSVVDSSDTKENSKRSWQAQLHLYEVPFYYIEYGMAQLGAIAMWKNYRNNSKQAINNYFEALKLGYTKSIGDIYATAGIKFSFSNEYVKELGAFLQEQLVANS